MLFCFESCWLLSSIQIPDTVSELGHEIFFACSSLKSAVLPEGIQTIPNGMFRRCKILMDVTIPSSVRRIEDRAFSECNELPGIQLPENLEFLGNYSFERCSQLLAISLPASLKRIGDSAFRECGHLIDLELNEGLEEIGDHAFEECRFLVQVRFPESLRVIRETAFNVCSDLQEVRFAEGLEEIEAYAFRDCRNIELITFPASLQKLGRGVFDNCSGLKDIYFLGNAPELDSVDPFSSVHNGAAIYHFEEATGFPPPTWGGLPVLSINDSGRVRWLIANGERFDTPLDFVDPVSERPLLFFYARNAEIGEAISLVPFIENEVLSYGFFAGREDVEYSVEISKDMFSWTTDGVVISDADPEGMRTASFDLDDGRCFVRFRFVQE